MPLRRTSSSSGWAAPTGTSGRLRNGLLLGLLLLGSDILSQGAGAETIPDPKNGSCSSSSTCDGPNSTVDGTPTTTGAEIDCISDAERGLCASDPEAMFRRCSPDEHCRDRDDFGAVVFVETSVFRDADTVEDCVDRDSDCEALAADERSCLLNPDWMKTECPKSCYICVDSNDDDDDGAELVELPIGVQQKMPSHIRDESKKKQFYDVIAETASYMSEEVYADDDLADARRDCRNTEKFCSWWVASTRGGFCNSDSARKSCGPACKACDEMILTEEELDIIDGCTPDEEKNAFLDAEDEDGNPIGDGSKTIDAMFRRIVGELPYPSPPGEEYPIVPGVNYTARVLSRPSLNPMIHKDMPFGSIDFHIGGPWIVVLEDFLSPEECDRMIELGDVVGRTRSTIEDEDDDEYEDEDEDDDEDGDGDDDEHVDDNNDEDEHVDDNNDEEEEATNDEDIVEGVDEEDGELQTAWRTSSTAWCKDECNNDPITKRIQRRIGLTTGVTDESYYEELQLLKYVEGQYYKIHHDESGDLHDDKFNADGPRLLTFFLYLNDVEEGGETRFSDLMGDDTHIHIDVAPKRGRALLWPSMQNEDLLAYDQRTYHAALEVKKGVKYGANAWLHLRDVRNTECDEDDIEEVKQKLSGLIS